VVTAIVEIGDVHKELRGFAPIGIMECWNDGFRGIKNL
jgi:hypothetical protein